MVAEGPKKDSGAPSMPERHGRHGWYGLLGPPSIEMDKGPEFSAGFFLVRSNGFFGLLHVGRLLKKKKPRTGECGA